MHIEEKAKKCNFSHKKVYFFVALCYTIRALLKFCKKYKKRQQELSKTIERGII